MEFNFQGALVGAHPAYLRRCLVLYVGVENGEVVKASFGSMTRKRTTLSRTELDPSLISFSRIDEEGFAGTMRIPTLSLDLEPCVYHIDVEGTFLSSLISGVNQIRAVRDGHEDFVLNTSFDGTINEGISQKIYKSVLEEPWYARVENYLPLEPGEHPRLLFRKSDIPALREHMKTPEGQAILTRLRYLLDGAEGNRPPAHYSSFTHAYMGGGYDSHVLDKPGVYTFTHVVGYGLLYQLTGEQVYATLGRDAFEEAMNGQRDRDDRYSFRKPGGGLRAGTVLGWMAVGYDLCYDGWDPEFREEATKALAEYDEGKGMSHEALARATMPPESNHFGSQVAGASLGLLAIDKEPGIDQDHVDMLLRVTQRNLIRNVVEGFGNGGMFQEGDGTGSMATYPSYLTALTGWKNAKGLDIINNDRPNVPMTTLKWLYLSRVSPEAGLSKDGSWDKTSITFPARGGYTHNVWDRDGLSGAGYFALGFGGLTPEQQSAHLWFYNEFMKGLDEEMGRPFDTVSVYPHLAVAAFVNWPFDVEPVNPIEVLPRIAADTTNEFFMWRSRWQDENDFVMSLLTKRTRGGYIVVKPDKTLDVDGEPWIDMSSTGGMNTWWVSEDGDQSLLTFHKDHQALLVDFSGKSGEEVVLATTLPTKKGEKLSFGDHTVTLLFPRSEEPPEIRVDADGRIVINNLALSVEEGFLRFAPVENGSS